MKFRNFYIWLVPLFLVAWSLGCKDEKSCNEFMDCNVKLHFYSKYKIKDQEVTIDSTIKSIKFYAETFMDTAANAKTFVFPLSPHTDSVAYIVKINSLSSDVVYVKYKTRQVFINYECGFRAEYTIDTIVSMQNRFDSISIVQPQVTISDEDNIKIFYNRSSH